MWTLFESNKVMLLFRQPQYHLTCPVSLNNNVKRTIKVCAQIKSSANFRVYHFTTHPKIEDMVGIEPTNRSNKLFTTLHRAGRENRTLALTLEWLHSTTKLHLQK